MEQLSHDVLALIGAHPELAAVLIGLTAFGESFAFISFFIPGTTILVASGALVQQGVLNPFYAVSAAAIGAILGDAISYWIGLKCGKALHRYWPFNRHPKALERGERFFQQYGWPSIFIGRFFGPLRAFVPLVAGTCKMPALPFYIANIVSALIWAPALLYSGYLLGQVYSSSCSPQEKGAIFGAVAVAFILAGYLLRRLFRTKES
jgi:membrane protein DedA with SNARE-associated domain